MLIWQETDLDQMAAAFEQDGFVAVQGLLPDAVIDAADGIADDLLGQLDARPWAAGEDYCTRFDIWTKVFSGIEAPQILALFDNEPMQAISARLAGPHMVAARRGTRIPGVTIPPTSC